jgi:hypothetical protein
VALLVAAAGHFYDSLTDALNTLKRKTQDALRDVMFNAVKRMEARTKADQAGRITVAVRAPSGANTKKGALQQVRYCNIVR